MNQDHAASGRVVLRTNLILINMYKGLDSVNFIFTFGCSKLLALQTLCARGAVWLFAEVEGKIVVASGVEKNRVLLLYWYSLDAVRLHCCSIGSYDLHFMSDIDALRHVAAVNVAAAAVISKTKHDAVHWVCFRQMHRQHHVRSALSCHLTQTTGRGCLWCCRAMPVPNFACLCTPQLFLPKWKCFL